MNRPTNLMISKNFNVALDPLTPGVNLIEAGAGAGKTFAIAMLVLRAVAELFIPIEEIVVVTFTRAATKELRDRVRRRLRQAAAALISHDQEYDEVLIQWRDHLENIDKSRAAIHRALADIDRAEISSIHGFCQRALQEHALAGGQIPDSELADEKDCQRQAAEDFWRRAVYPLPAWLAALVCHQYPDPEELAQSVAAAVTSGADIRPDNLSPEAAQAELQVARDILNVWWRQNAVSLQARLNQAIGQGFFKKELADNWPEGWQRLEEFAGTDLPAGWPAEFLPWLTTDGLFALTNGQKLRGDTKKQEFLAGLTPFADQEIHALTQAANQFLLALRLRLAMFLREEVPARLRHAGQISYNELTRRLAQALDQSQATTAHTEPVNLTAVSATNLTVELQNRYRMALIDEFQDTDIWQWRIFAKLFATGRHYLYLIGDPKQAIYRFRGADIFSYFQAGKAADRRLTLTKNFRSQPLLVAEINRLFSRRPKPFLFSEEQIDFEPAQAGRDTKDGWLWQNGAILPVCRYRLVTVNGKSQESIGRAIQNDCLHQIIGLLNPNNPARLIRTENGQEISRYLTHEDIAILTRTNNEAEELVQALATHGIAAVLDSRVSVFASQECQDLLTALTAMVAPGRTAALARALACDWFGLNGNELAALLGDEERLGAAQERWHGYQQRWLTDGVAAAILALLAGEAVYEHLRLQPRFERRIANILHLSELLSAAASAEDFGPGECLEWLQTRASDHGGEESEMRLESDRQAVRIVTMHGAKGLEFPVVFCPSLWRGLAGKNRSNQAACHDGSQLVVDLGSPQFTEAWQQAANEERAEELRLLYVALTRAKLQYVVFWPLLADDSLEAVAGSPLSYLLAGDEAVSSEEMRRLFLERAQEEGVATEIADDGNATSASGETVSGETTNGETVNGKAANDEAISSLTANNEPVVSLPVRQPTTNTILSARQFHGQFDRSWQIASFSSLARRGGEDEAITKTLAEEFAESFASGIDTSDTGKIEVKPQAEAQVEPEEAAKKILFLTLPKGARFGSLIHACLDKIDFSAPEDQLLAAATQQAERQAAFFGFPGGHENIARLVLTTVATPLPTIGDQASGGWPPGGWRLADLRRNEMVKEMPWSFALKKTWPREIGEILAGDPAVAPLSGPPVAGYLTGFIDLFCQWQGKYYIFDYKTNFLGERQSDYGAEALTQAMAEHNYGLQYWLYTLAVDRWLAWQRPDYNYDQHFGGVYYLFVRGMRRELSGAGVFATRPERATLERLAALLGEKR